MLELLQYSVSNARGNLSGKSFIEVIQPINCLRGWGHVICDYSCIILAWDLARVAELLQKAVAFFYAW